MKTLPAVSAFFAAALLVFPPFQIASAGSATWNLNPTSGDWNTAANWTPGTVPNGPSDTGTLDVSNTTSISFSAETELNGIAFNPGASPFTITATPSAALTISGTGLTNNSGIAQNLISAPDASGTHNSIIFSNRATAGSQTVLTTEGATIDDAQGGVTIFSGTSSAGNCVLINEGSTVGGSGGLTWFLDRASAGKSTVFSFSAATTTRSGLRTDSPTVLNSTSGTVFFSNLATAADATLINEGGVVNFLQASTAANARIINKGATVSIAPGGFTSFENSSAGKAMIINTGGNGGSGGRTQFTTGSDAGNSTLIARDGLGGQGGVIEFRSDSTGGTARIELFGAGLLDLYFKGFLPLTIGSLEGDGLVSLADVSLTIGSNNRTTTFAGTIIDAGSLNGGSLTKIGSGTLNLTSTSSYRNGTFVIAGMLLANSATGSALGTGDVQIQAGTLGGSGTVYGATTIGTGSGTGAVLAPGERGTSSIGTLTLQNSLLFNADGTYQCEFNATRSVADKVVVRRVTINPAAQFLLSSAGGAILTLGTTFTAIDNTGSSPILGNFANLTDGATITVGSNTFQANYEGGDGNDLTLTVVSL